MRDDFFFGTTNWITIIGNYNFHSLTELLGCKSIEPWNDVGPQSKLFKKSCLRLIKPDWYGKGKQLEFQDGISAAVKLALVETII